MSPVIQNILWFAVGIVGVIAVTKLIGKRKRQPIDEQDNTETSPIEGCIDKATAISVTQHPQGSAKEAFLRNISNLDPLFDSLNNNVKFNEVINDAIIEINNQELMDIWVKISKNPNAVMRILSMWGIRREDEIQFMTQSYHLNRYDTIDGQALELGKTYKVISRCWIYTHYDENGRSIKSVILKGKAQEL